MNQVKRLKLYEGTEICTIGERCYWNSVFSGLISCVVTDISDSGLTVKITATKNSTYTYGESIEIGYSSIVPKRFYKRTGLFRFVVTREYTWKKEI